MYIQGTTAHHHQDGVVRTRRWKMCDEVHRNWRPRGCKDWQWLKETMRAMTKILCLSIDITRSNKLLHIFPKLCPHYRVQMRYNEPTWLLQKKIVHVFFPKKYFSYEWILEHFLLQLVIINAYSCPNTCHVFFPSFKNKYEFLKCPKSL
jgi:hypothetical protein